MIQIFNILFLCILKMCYSNDDIIARLGAWSFESENPTVDIDISKISVIPIFNSQNLQNDIAVLRLSSPAPIASNPNINTACLSTSVAPGTRYVDIF